MKKDNKYKLAVFEDEDKADLVEYSKQMQKSIEKALDENQGEKGDKGDKGDKGELVDLIKEEEGKNISIESANLPAIEVRIEGESQQTTRSGKNLLDNTATTKISNGITFTVNSDKTVNVNGTNDTSANSSLVINRYDLSPGTYILNGCPSGGASNTYRLAIQETGSYSILGSIDIGNGSGEFTIDTTTNVQIAIFIQKGLMVNNLLFKPMLRKATIADDTYEQYGASPSPDYLSEIENLEGKNKLKLIPLVYDIITVNKDGSIVLNGTLEDDWTGATVANLDLKKGNYYFSFNSTGNLNGACFATQSGGLSFYTDKTFKLTSDLDTILNLLVSKGTYNNVIIKPMIKEGTVAKPYVPYNSLEIKDVGENLLDLSKCTFYNCKLNPDGASITSNISEAYYCELKTTQLNDYLLANKGKTVTFLTGTLLNKATTVIIYGTRANGSTYQEVNETKTGKCSLIVANDFTTITRVEFRFNRRSTVFTDTSTIINYAMLVLGTEEITYKPYQEQTEYFPLSEGQKLYKGSYLADDGIHPKRNQVVLNGTETGWYTLAGQTGTNTSYFAIPISDMKKASTLICDKFINRAVWNTDEEGIQSIIDNYIRLRINTSRASTVAELRTWLSNNPITVEYELAEEEIIPYTEDQKEAWEKIKNMILYKGTNNISCTGKLKIKYYTNEEMNEIYSKKEDLHEHANKSILDQTQEAFTTELKNKLDGLNNYVLPAPTSTTLGGVKAGSNITIDADGTINAQLGSSGETSANDYEVLSNKPQIAGITLQGNKSLADLGIQGVETGKGLSSNDYTTTEKAKLAGVEAQANKYIHPTTSGNKHVPSGGSTGQILKWSADGTAVWGADHTVATTSTDGLMSKTDKTKLNNIAEGANKYVHPTTSGNKHVPSGGSSGQILKWSADGTATWGADHSVVTASADGLMSKTDKTKLDAIETEANKYVHPSTSGNRHIPSGGSSGQVLKWQSDGTAKWDSLSSSGELGTDNLNTKKISGIYAQSTATNFLKSRNYPFDHADGFPFFDILLEVKNAGMYIMQELHLSYKISVQGQEVISYFTYMRFSTNNGSTWSAWRGHEGTTTQ